MRWGMVGALERMFNFIRSLHGFNLLGVGANDLRVTCTADFNFAGFLRFYILEYKDQ